MSIFVFLKLIGSLALLMYGMKTMSEALQKLTGGHLRHILGGNDHEPFYRAVNWYICDSFCTVFYCDNGNDS